MQINTIFFDVDGTIYGNDSGVWPMVGEKINLFMKEEVGIPNNKIEKLRMEYLDRYGTTLRGLHIHYNVDAKAYLEFVHDVPIEEKIKVNRKLEEMLKRLPQRKWLWTNASKAHAERVVGAMGIGGYFKGIIDVEAMGFLSKPDLAAYTVALETSGELEGKGCLFVDDRVENLHPAKELGAGTVLVGTSEPHPAADFSIVRLEELLKAMPQLVE